MNWILIANTTAPKGNYYTLLGALLAMAFFVLGYRLYKPSRKEKVDS